jgi:hypothetical protein
MNVTEMICSAMPLAASSAVPIQPIITMVPDEEPAFGQERQPDGPAEAEDREEDRPVGAPEPLEQRVVRRSPRARAAKRASTRGSGVCVPTEAMAAPATPSSGAPRLPKISTQFIAALSAAPPSQAQSTTRGRSSADRCERSTSASTAGRMPNPATRR